MTEESFIVNLKLGDIVVFKTPADNRTDYIKRLIGLPGDEIQFIDGDLHINNNQVLKSLISKSDRILWKKNRSEIIYRKTI